MASSASSPEPEATGMSLVVNTSANTNEKTKAKTNAKTQTKPKKKETDGPRKKRGTPSDFQGKRLEFLKKHIPDYVEASKNRETRKFWPPFFFDYWRAFPWRIPLNEEPPDAPEAAPADAEAAFKALDKDLTLEEEDEKAQIQQQTAKKIKQWFNRQRPGIMGLHGNPYFEFLARMRRQANEAPPRRLPDYQFYLHHPKYKDAVNERFERDHGDAPKEKKISLRCKVAQKMLAEETEEVRDKLKEDCTAAHALALEEYEEGEEGLPSVDPEIQKQVRGNFSAVVTPLLAGLRAYTGYALNIVAACPDGDSFEVVSANAGLVDGKDWAKWDPEGYAQMLPRFLRFVHALSLEESGQAAPLDGSAAPAPTAVPAGAPGPTVVPAGAPAPTTVPAGAPATSEAPPASPDQDGDVEMGPPPPPPLVDDDEDIMAGSILSAPAPSATPLAPAIPPAVPATTNLTAAAPVPSVPAAPHDVHPPAPATTSAAKPRPRPRPRPAALPKTTPTAPPAPSSPPRAVVPDVAALQALMPADESFGIPTLNAALHAELVGMGVVERGETIRRLRRMPSIELVRENNLARNRAMTAAWGLSGGGASFMGMAKKRDAEEERGRKKKRSKKGEEEEWDSNQSDESSGSDDSSDDEGVVSTPRATRSRVRKAPSTTQAAAGKPAGVVAPAKWAVNGKKILEKGAMGTNWAVLLQLWWKLEESSSFQTSTKTHPAKRRPKQVGVWVKNARVGTPDLSPQGFGREWWGWWESINPEWRLREGKLVREGEGDWGQLRCPGANGFLNVIICLKWWRDAMEEGSEEWELAVADVTWVLEGMLGCVRDTNTTATALPAPSTAASTPPPALPAPSNAPSAPPPALPAPSTAAPAPPPTPTGTNRPVASPLKRGLKALLDEDARSATTGSAPAAAAATANEGGLGATDSA
ncbi:hypothetical protein B0H11DRAFT_1928524 [Mycena galericulata]|nr:hypothetical protein B0H11DRAFT_1928524 [Mycena galericulata]